MAACSTTYLEAGRSWEARVAERLTSVGFIVEGQEGEGASTVYEVEVTANRPDGMNHRGLAREAAVEDEAEAALPLRVAEDGEGDLQLRGPSLRRPRGR